MSTPTENITFRIEVIVNLAHAPGYRSEAASTFTQFEDELLDHAHVLAVRACRDSAERFGDGRVQLTLQDP